MHRTLLHLAIITVIFAVTLPATAQDASPGDMQLVDRIIATVDDEIILESEVMQYVQDIVIRNRNRYSTPESVIELRDQIMQELINQKILLAAAKDDTNIVVEDRQVDQTLDMRINEIVQELGSEEALEKYYGKPIRQIRREFRKQVSDNLYIDQLRSRKLQTVSVNRKEVEDFYAAHKDEFPEMPTRYHLAHILFEIKPEEEATDRAEALADSLFQDLLMGADFEQLAINNSDDRSTGAKGGLLGTTQRGDLVPEYESVAFGLSEGEISEPVRSRFGFHIIRLNWRRGEKINSSHILISLRPTDDDSKRTMQLARDVYDKLQDGADFAELAKEYSDDKDSGPFGGELGWFNDDELKMEYRAAINRLSPGQVSEPFETRLGIHILKLQEIEEPRPIDIKQDWDAISRLAQTEKQDKIYREWVEELKKEVYIELYTDEEAVQE